MPPIPIFFDDWLKERYSENYITITYRYLRKVDVHYQIIKLFLYTITYRYLRKL